MIQGDKFRRFEAELSRKEKVDIKKNFRIMDALYREARALGVFPLKEPLEGIDVDIKIAKAINRVSKIA